MTTEYHSKKKLSMETTSNTYPQFTNKNYLFDKVTMTLILHCIYICHNTLEM